MVHSTMSYGPQLPIASASGTPMPSWTFAHTTHVAYTYTNANNQKKLKNGHKSQKKPRTSRKTSIKNIRKEPDW